MGRARVMKAYPETSDIPDAFPSEKGEVRPVFLDARMRARDEGSQAMTRLVRTVRPSGERFRLYSSGDTAIEVFIRLESSREVVIAEKAGRSAGSDKRPIVSFDMPPSVHLERE